MGNGDNMTTYYGIAVHTETNKRYGIYETHKAGEYAVAPYDENGQNVTNITCQHNQLYKHYKGNYYHVLLSVMHRNGQERFVLYADKQGKLWLRPYAMFYQHVTHNGKRVPRFRRIQL